MIIPDTTKKFFQEKMNFIQKRTWKGCQELLKTSVVDPESDSKLFAGSGVGFGLNISDPDPGSPYPDTKLPN